LAEFLGVVVLVIFALPVAGAGIVDGAGAGAAADDDDDDDDDDGAVAESVTAPASTSSLLLAAAPVAPAASSIPAAPAAPAPAAAGGIKHKDCTSSGRASVVRRAARSILGTRSGRPVTTYRRQTDRQKRTNGSREEEMGQG
jgi:hypothetical protein